MNEFVQTLAELPSLFLRLSAQLEANTRALDAAHELIGNTRIYERDAAVYLNVDVKTLYNYRQHGLAYEKIGRIISYRQKDLDAWRRSGLVRQQR